MASTVLTDEDRGRIHQLASEGLTSREIARQLELPPGSVGGYIAYLKREGAVYQEPPEISGNPAASPGSQPTGSVVSEVATAIRDGVQLGRETAQPPRGTQNPVETVKEAVETGINLARQGGNGNGQPQGELLQFLSTLVTQQEKSSQAIIAQLNTQHTNALERMKEEARLRGEEAEKKFEREKERDRDYWGRIEAARQKADEQRAELEKEQRKLITDRLDSVDAQVTKNLEHANRLIEEREKSSDRYIEMTEKFSAEVAELRKDMGKEDGTQELIRHAIDRFGEPIIKAIEKRGGGNAGAAAALGSPTTTAPTEKESKVGMGDAIKAKVKQAILGQLKPYIEEGLEQARKHLQKWPKVSMKILVDLLWSWRMTEIAPWVQTAITFIVLNDLEELVGKAGQYLTDDLRKLLAKPNAKKWWSTLQEAINERIAEEEEAQKAYDAYRHKGAEDKKE